LTTFQSLRFGLNEQVAFDLVFDSFAIDVATIVSNGWPMYDLSYKQQTVAMSLVVNPIIS